VIWKRTSGSEVVGALVIGGTGGSELAGAFVMYGTGGSEVTEVVEAFVMW